MDRRITELYWALRITLGAVAFLAGCDKFIGLLADWEHYLSPAVASLLPVSGATFMRVAGVVEIAVGLTILAGVTRIGGYVMAAWLVVVALSLVTSGAFLDVAVRDLVMALAAFSLARLTEVADTAVAHHQPLDRRAIAA